MTKDPLFQRIVAALNRDLDEDLFEQCAAALLSESYPSLAPTAGGNDAGYDVSIGTQQVAFPLLTTVDHHEVLSFS